MNTRNTKNVLTPFLGEAKMTVTKNRHWSGFGRASVDLYYYYDMHRVCGLKTRDEL